MGPRIVRVALATACGGKKWQGTLPACDLYKSPRIKAFCRRRHQWGFPLYILSAKYGLIRADESVESYEQRMTPGRAEELAPQVAEVMRGFDWFVYFKGGAASEYAVCIRTAADIAKVPVVLMGYANMGGYAECIEIAKGLVEGHPPPDRSLKSLEVIGVQDERQA